jgi:hypothetical protein
MNQQLHQNQDPLEPTVDNQGLKLRQIQQQAGGTGSLASTMEHGRSSPPLGHPASFRFATDRASIYRVR